jgi:beta-glucosidase
VVYGEHVFIGYRGYDARLVEPMFPFGHGLTYSQFEYANLKVPTQAPAGEPPTIRVTVRNTGSSPSAEVVQIYVAPPEDGLKLPCPPRKLAGFGRTPILEPGQEHELEICLDPSTFGFFDPDQGQWIYPAGEFTIEAARSSRDIVTKAVLQVTE